MIIGLFDVSLGNEERIMILDFFRKQDKIFLMQFEAYIKLRKFDSGTKIISTVMQHLHRAMILREDTSEIPIWLRTLRLLWMVAVVVMVLIHKEDPRMWLWMINANEYVGFPIHIHFLRRIHTRSEGTLARNAADGPDVTRIFMPEKMPPSSVFKQVSHQSVAAALGAVFRGFLRSKNNNQCQL